MQRIAFKMKLLPGFEDEYKRRHDLLWPELRQTLFEAGVRDYSIFLDEETLTLFAYHLVEEHFEENFLPNHPVVKKWWAYMADIMETNPDNSPISVPLKEVFHVD